MVLPMHARASTAAIYANDTLLARKASANTSSTYDGGGGQHAARPFEGGGVETEANAEKESDASRCVALIRFAVFIYAAEDPSKISCAPVMHS